MSHKKFGPDRFSRVYWIQTDKQTDKPNLYIDCCSDNGLKGNIMSLICHCHSIMESNLKLRLNFL